MSTTTTTTFSRTNTSVIGRWWLGVDRWTIAALVVLAAAGVVLAKIGGGSIFTSTGANASFPRSAPAMRRSSETVIALPGTLGLMIQK